MSIHFYNEIEIECPFLFFFFFWVEKQKKRDEEPIGRNISRMRLRKRKTSNWRRVTKAHINEITLLWNEISDINPYLYMLYIEWLKRFWTLIFFSKPSKCSLLRYVYVRYSTEFSIIVRWQNDRRLYMSSRCVVYYTKKTCRSI